MDLQLQFVDSISASPVVRLDLDTAPWSTQVGTRFDPPAMKYAVADTLLADGEHIAASAYGDRTIVLRLRLLDVTEDEAAGQLQVLFRELNRASNFLRYQPGTSNPVWFRTKRCSADAVDFDPVEKTVTVQVPAEPFAYGIRETLSQVTVTNDPVGVPGPALNANPYFETDALNWSAVGGTFVRSTAQFHQGTASALLTPDGVTANTRAVSENVPATPGVTYRLSAWLRCAVSRNVNLQSIFFDAGAVSLGTTTTTVALTAGTWTLAEMTVTAPATTATGILRVEMTSTPLVSHTLHIDEAMSREASGEGSMFFDVTSPKGDVETPLFMQVVAADLLASDRIVSVFAVRRRGTPANVPFALQAETMTVVTDTTVQPNDAAMSGAGNNYIRCTFAGTSTMAERAIKVYPAAAGVDVRGTYRVFIRGRKSVAVGPVTVRLVVSVASGGASYLGDTVTWPATTNLRWVDLGLVQFPLGADPDVDGYSGTSLQAGGQDLRIHAARASGTTNLDIDALVFVPADDRLCLIKWPHTNDSATGYVVDGATPSVYGLDSGNAVTPIQVPELAGGPPVVSPGVTNRIYMLPDVTFTTVVADSKTETVRITPYYWPRYLHVRPATT